MIKEYNIERFFYNFKNKYKCGIVLYDIRMSIGFRVIS